MKFYKTLPLFALALATLTLHGCIADEPANAECDIERCWIHLDQPETIFYHDYDTLAGEPVSVDHPADKIVPTSLDSIVFITRWNATVSQPVPLYIEVTPGAKLYIIENGREVPFTSGTAVDLHATAVDEHAEQHFVVRSEDGKWNRHYRISIQVPPMPSYPPEGFELKFDSYALNSAGQYYVWTESNPFLTDIQWANGNPGFRMSKSSAKPEEYPTVAVDEGGVDGGPYLKLTTRDTGGFGRMVNMRIAAGNHFIGSFDVGQALNGQAGALAATRFGQPFAHKPIRLRGFYRFKPGPTKQDRQGNPMDEADVCDIYCVFYRNTDAAGNQVQLDGANILTSENIVGLARLNHDEVDTSGEKWVPFDLPLVYTTEVTEADVKENRYSMTMCFSSSIDGAYFRGAVDSELHIDNVTLECEY